MKDKFYHYTECGLDNVFLVNGCSVDKEGVLFIKDVLGLHRTIGYSLVHSGRKLKGKEIKFARHYMDLSQKTLGQILGVDYQTILLWEKGRGKITVMADKFLKLLFAGYLDDEAKIRQTVDAISDLDNNRSDQIELAHKKDGWKSAA